MTQQFNRMPTYREDLVERGKTVRGWYSLWSGLWSGQPTGPAAGITVGTTPFKYVAPQGGSVIVQGGTTSAISVSRDGITFFLTGQTSGMFSLSQGDTLQVAYTLGPPTMTFIPR